MKHIKGTYPPPQQKLIDGLKCLRSRNPESHLAITESLLSFVESNPDPYLESYCYLYQGDALLTQGHLKTSMNLLLKAKEIQEAHSYAEPLQYTYNLLGINYYSQGDELLSINSLYHSLEISLKLGDFMMQGRLYNNIGAIYLSLFDYTEALKFFQKSIDAFKQASPAESALIPPALSLTYLNQAECYCRLEKYETAENFYYNAMFLIPEADYEAYVLCFKAIHSLILYHLGKKEKAIEIACNIVNLPTSTLSNIGFIEYTLDIISILITEKKKDESGKLLQILEEVLRKESAPSSYLQLCKSYIRYCETFYLSSERISWLRKYYVNRKHWISENRTSVIAAIDNRLLLEQESLEKEQLSENNKELSKITAQDALTGLGNRYGLKHFNSVHFPVARAHQQSFGIVLVDIDYLKQYNDTYGHVEGDRCIQLIADCIRKVLPDGCYAARYGGDEFFLVCLGKSEEELVRIVQELHRQVQLCQIVFEAHPTSKYITLSIGIFNGVPETDQTVTDFIHAADNALYTVKQSTKNGYSFATSLK